MLANHVFFQRLQEKVCALALSPLVVKSLALLLPRHPLDSGVADSGGVPDGVPPGRRRIGGGDRLLWRGSLICICY